MTHHDRRLGEAPSPWVRSFDASDLRPLIVCRGPVRKEALDVFREMGMSHVGMLLSEKDSIIYTHALAPELRGVHPRNVHRVADYTGASGEEKAARIREILAIAKTFGYDSIFAGYGFMAEEEEFVAAIEGAGLRFIGPGSRTVKAAGRKDEAKRTALEQGVSVTPGINDATTRALLAKVGDDREALLALCAEKGVEIGASELAREELSSLAEAALEASYEAGVDLLSIDELGKQVAHEVEQLLLELPRRRVRLKAIGGGGGKGQRILGRPGSTLEPSEHARRAASEAPAALREILGEVKATGAGANRNVLIELNVETTRHHEIQLVGNGDWCLSLGGRDCSLQMHEQKLLEYSVTQEALRRRLETAEGAAAEALREDLASLESMEAEAERFGRAVGLDSASTFECIVDGGDHYFMEVNTRIQVEHRVSELCYALRFTNPGEPDDFFEVDSLVETMALLARHKERLPAPTRVARRGAAVEARLNATDPALSPHAGGVISDWSPPIEGEIRDDQGICSRNPDTGQFMRYRLAGAYDSNIALLVTSGDDRRSSFERLREIIRITRLRGEDLHTNLEFHYGLLNWLLAQGVDARATTRFVLPYLTQIGLLQSEADRIDLWSLAKAIFARTQQRIREACQEDEVEDVLAASATCLNGKQTLLMRPLERFLSSPHLLGGWLSQHRDEFSIEDGLVHWHVNPVAVADGMYDYLNMHQRPGQAAASVIWDGDRDFLDRAHRFYDELTRRLEIEGRREYRDLLAALAEDTPPEGFTRDLWDRVRGAHRGHQMGLEMMGVLPLIGDAARYFDLRVEGDLSITIPERLLDPDLQGRMRKVLAPPPAIREDVIVAASGGMYYAQEAPHMPPFVEVGDHFEAGQPLYVIEIMKMFNKVTAPFSGTIDEILVTGGAGTIVSKGQPLFAVTPDEPLVEEDPEARKAAFAERTREVLAGLR